MPITTTGRTGSKSSISTVAVALTEDNAFIAKAGVQIRAALANTDAVWVGVYNTVTSGSNDSTDGFPLLAGESILIKHRRPHEIYIIASSGTQKVHFLIV
jgi:hypothetical protein